MPTSDPSLIDRLIDIGRGVLEADDDDRENRGTRRHDYEGNAALVQLLPDGGKSVPTVVRCKDISSNGLGVFSRYMLHVGHEGALLMQRSNGREVIVGVRVVHCKYVGNMNHESGLAYISVPAELSLDDFRDDGGHLPALKAA